MKLLLSLLPLAVASLAAADPRGVPAELKGAQCCFKESCVRDTERLYHAKLFYNRKQGMTPDEFNRYWSEDHLRLVQDFHLRMGVSRYSQVRIFHLFSTLHLDIGYEAAG